MLKSSISCQFTIRKGKERKDGLFPITLRITQFRKSIYIRTQFAIKASQWNRKKHEVRSSHPNHKVINDWMQRELTEISTILINESEHFTKEQLKSPSHSTP